MHSTPAQRLLLGLVVVLVVQALFVVSYVGAWHNPQPHNLSFGVSGQSTLATAVGRQISLREHSYADEAAALRAIDHRAVYGALVSDDSGTKLLVAPAASNAAAASLTAAFTRAAAARGERLDVVQVHALANGDRLGIVPFLVAMALVVGGYLSATITTTLAGAASGRRLAAALGAAAIAGALVTDTVAGPLLGGLPAGHFVKLWGVFAFVMLAVAYAAAALQRLLGVAGTLIVIVTFVIFGAPAAGGSLPRAFLPGFWATIGPLLPPGAATTLIRNTVYFGGTAIGEAILVLGIYLLAGGAVLLRARRAPALEEGAADLDAAGAAAAIV
ncbi:MAG: DUF3533 domain-containing protein [Gaiellaceae bacterium]